MSGVTPMPYFALYSATKAMLTSFFTSLHYELKKQKVKVTVVLPGGVYTRPDIIKEIKGQGLWGRLSAKSPEFVAEKSLKAVQKNKVKYIIDKVSLIHSLDSLSLAEEISKRALKIGRVMDVLVEINSGREENKGGIMPEDLGSFLDSLKSLAGVRVRGLMTMAPRCEKKEDYIKYFSLTKELFDKFFGNDTDAVLSMGMSESYEEAIMCGATLVRVGSKIFGRRY